LGYVAWTATRSVTSRFFDDYFLQLYAAFVVLNHIAGLGCAFLVTLIASRWGLSFGQRIIVMFFFLCSNAVLNYMQAGTAYIPGLFWQLLAMYLFIRASESRRYSLAFSVGAGLALGLAALMWFVYVLTIPAVLGFWYLWARDKDARTRLHLAHVAGLTALVSIVLCYTFVAVVNDLTTGVKFIAWYREASHGLAQNRQLLRLPMGFPRAFIDLGSDGVILKRFLFHDPYSPVSAADLLRLSVWKLLVVYSGLASLVAIVLRQRDGSRMLIPYFAGVIPVFLFATILFEPSQPERYLPFFPVMIPLVAIATSQFSWRGRLDRILLLCFAAIVVTNFIAHKASLDAGRSRARVRIGAIASELKPKSRVVLLSFRDDVNRFYARFPFDQVSPVVRSALYYLVEPSSGRNWRAEFATMVLRTWNGGGEVWASRRLWSDRPQSEWEWTEGDDPILRWSDLAAVFKRFQVKRTVGGDDGFAEVLDTDANRELIAALTMSDTHGTRQP